MKNSSEAQRYAEPIIAAGKVGERHPTKPLYVEAAHPGLAGKVAADAERRANAKFKEAAALACEAAALQAEGRTEMHMHILGLAPTSKKGEGFCRCARVWDPLWAFCEEISAVAANGLDGHLDDGPGLNAAEAKVLAQELKRSIERDQWAKYIDRLHERAADMPDESRWLLPALREFAEFLEDCGGFQIWV